MSPVPAVGSPPGNKRKGSGSQDGKDNSGREMESFQKSPWGWDHPAWPARAHSASVLLLLVQLSPVRSWLVFGCFTWEEWMRFRYSQPGGQPRFFRDASAGYPSFPLRTVLRGVGG